MVNERVNNFMLCAAHNCSSVRAPTEPMKSVGRGWCHVNCCIQHHSGEKVELKLQHLYFCPSIFLHLYICYIFFTGYYLYTMSDFLSSPDSLGY